jgi:alanyl-tRNA synthetase
MTMMTSSEIRNSFLKFFEERRHTIIPSSPVVPYDDPTILFANAGMNQFKDVFLGLGKRTYDRAADTQKCIRVSGKHNDLEEVGRDTYHHTFFEMLGNWSFGDYYKKEAIEWAWELLTNVWGLPKNRLWATVYKNDDEAEQFWKYNTDIDPNHILRFGEKDNFWEMGETGPCGPCSEIHIDRTPDGNATAEMVNAGLQDVMEIWNLVFIQYNRDEFGKLTPLPATHVDTGMGFERICAVLQNKDSNYDTDIFTPIINRVSEITNKPYDGNSKSITSNQQSEIDTAIRVISDHIRTLAFAIGDGASPSNEGRGYVLRRILRRASRFGRTLGMHEPFLFDIVPTLVETMGSIFPEIKTNQKHIQKIIKGEEESFNTTLDRGLERFEEVVQQIRHSKTFPGEDAFKLYDTFGFPLDLTELMASERGLRVDVGTFVELMEKQKDRSRGIKTSSAGQAFQADDPEWLTSKRRAREIGPMPFDGESVFTGYDELENTTKILGAQDHLVWLEKTPFYAEAGGQEEDWGTIRVGDTTLKVIHTQKSNDVNVHVVDVPNALSGGQKITAQVDALRRNAIMRNHSATHLLHNALRQVLGNQVQQAGSLVEDEYLRFDFSHNAKLTDEELKNVEALVNEKIKEDISLTHHRNIPLEEARNLGAHMFFGEKYGDRVNVVQFGEFSKEFCGGTHVKSTGDIGYFKILSESSVASGVRRIEAVTHDSALKRLKLQDISFFDRLDNAYQHLEELSVLKEELSSFNKSKAMLIQNLVIGFKQRIEDMKHSITVPEHISPELAACYDQLNHRNRSLEELLIQFSDIKKSLEKELTNFRIKSLTNSIDDLIAFALTINDFKLVSAKVSAPTMDVLKSLGDTLRSKIGSGVGILASVIEEKIQFVCVVTDNLYQEKKLEAGKIIGAVAKLVGGGGGGKPHMATAGGKDIAKLDEALIQAKSIVESFLQM